MRELTKSMLKMSWTMPIFGLDQTTGFFLSEDKKRSTEAFNAVAETARNQVGGTMRKVLDAGDEMQEGMTNMMFRMFPIEAFDPSGAMKTALGVMQRAAAATGVDIPKGPGGSQDGDGWGPMPPTGSARR